MSITMCSDKNKGAEHIAQMRRLVCVFVFRSESRREQYNTCIHTDKLRHEKRGTMYVH